MKFIIKAVFALTSLLPVHQVYAQQGMKAPISYRLNNGITLIVAENAGLGKIYSRLTVENQNLENETPIHQIVNNYLEKKAKLFNSCTLSSDKGKTFAQVQLTTHEANTSSNVIDFENALNFVSATFKNMMITEELFEEMKTTYTGNKADLDQLTLHQVQDFYTSRYAPSNTFITIAGDISPSSARALTNKAFGNSKIEFTL